ncbi:hypothetical protein [Burkholderia anthina]|uniref:hypothetical protein n=1 Tax=Burkholderia anthina TaxID=179879 RepID=UPI00158B7384
MAEESIFPIPDWLLGETFALQYSPNCPSRFLVRLVGRQRARIDLKPYCTAPEDQLTHDALGFGKSLAEAAEKALTAKLSAAPVAGPVGLHGGPPAEPAIADLSMLVKRLASALRRSAPGDPLSDQALHYLQRNGLAGSPLRTVTNPGSITNHG